MKTSMTPIVLSIAGTDPSGGAGIQADMKAISATGSYAASVVTALVAQNTTGVQSIQEIPDTFVQQQLQSVFQDLSVRTIKIGMLHDERIIACIVSTLNNMSLFHGTSHCPPIVFDPVMVAKNGSVLLKLETIEQLKNTLLPLCTLITPNLFETEQLVNRAIKTSQDMAEAAQQLGDQYQINVLVKGGHLESEQAKDVLYLHQTQQWRWFELPRIETSNTHGTGCTLSAAIASFLAQDYPLEKAIFAAKHYLTYALDAGRFLNIGQGHGPVDHFYFLENRHAAADLV